MEKTKEIVKVDSVEAYNEFYGFETLHPLVTVADFSQNRKPLVGTVQYNYGVYAIYIKDTKCCEITYGRQPYDYDEGSVISFAPGQTATVVGTPATKPVEATALVFHPDLIRGTQLGRTINDYTFFSYDSNEALQLSDEEHGIIMDCIDKIRMELQHGIDKHSRTLITMNIELLLNYLMRCYDRQFITRRKANRGLLARFESLLNEYFTGDNAEREGLPTVKYFADKIHLSPNYFGDMVKKETGRSAIDHIQAKLTGIAKERVLDDSMSISEVAYNLGFKYPQHFGRFFKQHVGCTPREYRNRGVDS